MGTRESGWRIGIYEDAEAAQLRLGLFYTPGITGLDRMPVAAAGQRGEQAGLLPFQLK